MELANQSYVQLWGHPCTHAQDTRWQSGMHLCIMPGLPTILVQELNVGTVSIPEVPNVMIISVMSFLFTVFLENIWKKDANKNRSTDLH